MSGPTMIDTLLRLVPDSPSTVLTHLSAHPHLASKADRSGYSLLHAAASYNQLDLLRTLVRTYNVSPDITDSEGETPLFAAETVTAAKCLVEDLGADVDRKNEEGVSAEDNARENVEDGGEWTAVVEYLSSVRGRSDGGVGLVSATNETSANDDGSGANGTSGSRVHAPPPLPAGVRITGMRTVAEDEVAEGQEPPDPEFRRRIEELAAREDFQTEEGQRDLKKLIEDAVGGLGSEGEEATREVRRRLG